MTILRFETKSFGGRACKELRGPCAALDLGVACLAAVVVTAEQQNLELWEFQTERENGRAGDLVLVLVFARRMEACFRLTRGCSKVKGCDLGCE